MAARSAQVTDSGVQHLRADGCWQEPMTCEQLYDQSPSRGVSAAKDFNSVANGVGTAADLSVESLFQKQLDASLRIVEDVLCASQNSIARQLASEYEKLSVRAPATVELRQLELDAPSVVPISRRTSQRLSSFQLPGSLRDSASVAPPDGSPPLVRPAQWVVDEIETVAPLPEDYASERRALRDDGEDDASVDGAKRMLFGRKESIKESVRKSLTVKEYHVEDFYGESIASCVARSPYFESLTLAVIAINSIWIAVDADYNPAEVLVNAPAGFQVVEHLFCVFFVSEWIIRFLSFANKLNCLKDTWFVFDSALVLLMVLEDWFVSVYLLSTGKTTSPIRNTSLVRLFRLLRLMRIVRMVKLMRAFPELMVLIKGIGVAARSVFFTLTLLMAVVYVFAIIFTQLTKDTDIGEAYFDKVPVSMYNLLIRGTLPDLIDTCDEINAHSWVLGALFLFFVLLASLTIMNMLVGILVEVVGIVAKTEKEDLEALFLKNHMLKLFSSIDEDGDQSVSKTEVERILDKPEAVKTLNKMGVDVLNLVDLIDYIFKDDAELTFVDFMEWVLQLRGSNGATVKDIMVLRHTVTSECRRLEAMVKKVAEKTVRSVSKDSWPAVYTRSNASTPR